MKKRYMLTLDEDLVKEYRSYCASFKLAQGQLSSSVEDMMREMNQMFKRCQEKGKLTIGDMFQMMGENIQEAMNYEKQTPKAKEVVRKPTKRKV